VLALIMNHAPIGKYRLRFFPKESFAGMCGEYLIETRGISYLIVHVIKSLGI